MSGAWWPPAVLTAACEVAAVAIFREGSGSQLMGWPGLRPAVCSQIFSMWSQQIGPGLLELRRHTFQLKVRKL